MTMDSDQTARLGGPEHPADHGRVRLVPAVVANRAVVDVDVSLQPGTASLASQLNITWTTKVRPKENILALPKSFSSRQTTPATSPPSLQ